ncbi:MAG: helicase-associated domain-containing protein [Pontiellaceae bacterium]|nr:helicase-associated domain-containing protein [Pontiellaceae bacterium]
MKIWKDMRLNPFEWFGKWEQLPLETRRLFLEHIGSDLKVDPKVFSAEARKALLDAGFMESDGVRLVKTIRQFRNLVRSMNRYRHFDQKSPTLSVDYVSDHLDFYECNDFPGLSYSRYRHGASSVSSVLVKMVTDASWLKTFINCGSALEWAGRTVGRYNQPQLSDESFRLLRRWVERMLAGENPLPLSSLLEDADSVAEAVDALRAGLLFMLLFPGLSGENLLPVVGVWPMIHERMNRAKALAPKSGALPEGFAIYDVPLLLHDMTAVLVAAGGEGLRLKADGSGLYKKEEARLAERLLDDPPSRCGYEPPYLGRINEARNWLKNMEMVSVRESKKERHFVALKKGRTWLAGTDAERLKALHDHMHASRRRFADGKWGGWDQLDFVPFSPQSHVGRGEVNLEDRVANAFADCPVGEWLEAKTFLRWQSESNNPLLQNLSFYPERMNSDALREKRWCKVLIGFLYERLLILGGAKLAFDDQGDVRFSITPAGAYLIGTREEFQYTVEVAEGSILIQPDFEIIFTAPNPGAESEFSRFADRIGNQVGALFKITRASVLRALNSEQTGEQILVVLEAFCAKNIPANVRKQVLDWSNAFRRVAFQKIQVIECPDAETALLVCGLFPKKAERLTDTMVRISGVEKTLEPMKKKLRENGVGIL